MAYLKLVLIIFTMLMVQIIVCNAVSKGQCTITCDNDESLTHSLIPTARITGPPGKKGPKGDKGIIGMPGKDGLKGDNGTCNCREYLGAIKTIDDLATKLKTATARLESFKQLLPVLPKSCDDVYWLTHDDIVNIYPLGEPKDVSCKFEQSSGHWTIIQRRIDGQEEFYRPWVDYQEGFGSSSKEFWIGLDALHAITNSGDFELYIELEEGGEIVYAKYSVFKVGNVDFDYQLTISGYTGTAGDSMGYHNGKSFSTYDRDNDLSSGNCASINDRGGGWWYNNCSDANLNGPYDGSEKATIHWWYWKNNRESLKSVTMMIRKHQVQPVDMNHEFNLIRTRLSQPQTCDDAFWISDDETILNIFPGVTAKTVLCKVDAQQTRWTVIQRRIDGRENFYHNWRIYEDGFGSAQHEYWLGLEALHKITSSGQYELRIDLEDIYGETAFAIYSTFIVGHRDSNYQLYISGYTGTAGDSMEHHNGKAFSTYDRDNDSSSVNCASINHRGGGWWYSNCSNANLNGPYDGSEKATIHWWYWKNTRQGLKSVTMMIRKKY